MPHRSFTRASQIAIVAALTATLALAACSKKEDAPPPAASAPAAPAPAAAPPPTAAPAQAAAPTAAAREKDAHAFKVGELSAYALRDGGLEVPNDNKVFGVGKTPEDVAAVLSAAGQPTDKLQLSIQPLLVKSGNRVLLFDTGAGANFGPGNGKLTAALAEAGVDPKSVTDIFISHVHGDHVGGLIDAKGALMFPSATIHLSKPEWTFLSEMKPDMAKMVGLPGHDALVAAMKPVVDAFAPGAELVPGVVKAVEIKGHTPGHSGYLITSGSDSLLYIGDAMHHFVISVQKPEWTIAFDSDSATAAASRAALISQSASSGQRIYAVHFPYPGIGKITGRGNEFAWVGE